MQIMADPSTEQSYNPIRSLNRGMAVLQVINREGPVSLTQICNATELPYPTVFRIVHTLVESGFVEREPSRKRYRATLLVRTLSSGFHDDARLVKAARPHIVELTNKFAWPLSIATRVGNMMMVRDSTHSLTSLTFTNYAPGYTLPLAECSTGKVHLAFCDEAERGSIVQGLKMLDGGADRMGLLLLDDGSHLDEIRAQGYATQARNTYTSNPGKTSSIAVPVISDGVLQGSLALIFFSAGLRMTDAEEKFIENLKATAAAIGADLAQ